MIRPEVVGKRLGKLDEYLAILRRLQQYSYEEFIDNPERYGSAERFLQLAVEALTDLGNHVIAELELGTVDWYSDIPQLLHEAGYIDADMREQWIRMIGFRNVLVHDSTLIETSFTRRYRTAWTTSRRFGGSSPNFSEAGCLAAGRVALATAVAARAGHAAGVADSLAIASMQT